MARRAVLRCTLPVITPIIVVFSTVGLARAEETGPAKEPGAREERHHLSVLFSPIQPIYAWWWMSAEYAFTPKWSVGINGGIAFADTQFTDALAFTVGAQGRYYVFRTFESGVPLILDVHYLDLDLEYLALAPLTGYKHVFPFGLTLEGTLGPSLSYELRDSRIDGRLLIRLGIGWSF